VLLPDDRPLRIESVPAFVWSPEAVDSLLAGAGRVAAKAVSKFDYTPLLRITAMLRLRLGEVLGLQWQDFDKAADNGAGVLHVRRQWLTSGVYGPPKTAKAVRSIPLPPGVRDDLIALRLASSFSRDDDPVFASVSGSPLGHRNVARRGFETARDEAKLPESVTFHDLRHAAASRLIRAGLDPVTVAGVLGHADATTTLRSGCMGICGIGNERRRQCGRRWQRLDDAHAHPG
jgi:integrase